MVKEIKKNVFVSHHHKDDASVDGISRLAAAKVIIYVIVLSE